MIEMSVNVLWDKGELPPLPPAAVDLMRERATSKLTDILRVNVSDSSIIREQHAYVMGNVPPDLENHKVFTLFVSDSDEFYISDQTAVMFNAYGFEPYGNIGFALLGVDMYLPISPCCVLAILDGSEPRLQDTYGKRGFFRINKSCIEALNRLQVLGAEKFVANKTGDFSSLEQILEECPDTRSRSVYQIQLF